MTNWLQINMFTYIVLENVLANIPSRDIPTSNEAIRHISFSVDR